MKKSDFLPGQRWLYSEQCNELIIEIINLISISEVDIYISILNVIRGTCYAASSKDELWNINTGKFLLLKNQQSRHPAT